MSVDEHFCGCCGEQIGAGTRSDPVWCAHCKPHIKGYTDAPLWDRTFFAQFKKDCPFQVGAADVADSVARSAKPQVRGPLT